MELKVHLPLQDEVNTLGRVLNQVNRLARLDLDLFAKHSVPCNFNQVPFLNDVWLPQSSHVLFLLFIFVVIQSRLVVLPV